MVTMVTVHGYNGRTCKLTMMMVGKATMLDCVKAERPITGNRLAWYHPRPGIKMLVSARRR